MNEILSIIPVATALALFAASGTASAAECTEFDTWQSPNAYQGGELVAHGGSVYQCKDFPFNGWCGVVAYEPGSEIGASAWDLVEACEDNVPTCSCESSSLCESWSEASFSSADRVYDATTNTVYACNAWPYSDWCGNSSFQPGVDYPSEESPYWELAWSVVDECP